MSLRFLVRVTKATLPGRDPPQNSDEFKGMH
jgi:hypothetical protein